MAEKGRGRLARGSRWGGEGEGEREGEKYGRGGRRGERRRGRRRERERTSMQPQGCRRLRLRGQAAPGVRCRPPPPPQPHHRGTAGTRQEEEASSPQATASGLPAVGRHWSAAPSFDRKKRPAVRARCVGRGSAASLSSRQTGQPHPRLPVPRISPICLSCSINACKAARSCATQPLSRNAFALFPSALQLLPQQIPSSLQDPFRGRGAYQTLPATSGRVSPLVAMSI